MPFIRGLVRAQAHTLRVVVIELVLGVGEILGNINHDGTRPSRGRNVKRLLNNRGNIFSALHHETVFHDGARHAHHIGFLKRVLTN